MSEVVHSVSFVATGADFVTGGHGAVRFWSLDVAGHRVRSAASGASNATVAASGAFGTSSGSGSASGTGSGSSSGSALGKSGVVSGALLSSAPAQLGDFSADTIVDVKCSRSPPSATSSASSSSLSTPSPSSAALAASAATHPNVVFALTATGRLLCIDARRAVEKWVDLRMPTAHALALHGLPFINFSNFKFLN
jgi:hypothetical protein